MGIEGGAALYWDSSALVSVVLPDSHHDTALVWTRRRANHFMSTLAWTEVLATIARYGRSQRLLPGDAGRTIEEFERGPWRRILDAPDWNIVRDLASKWSLTGPDLWHLGLAKTLRQEQLELRLLSFDQRLVEAAAGEGLAAIATSAT